MTLFIEHTLFRLYNSRVHKNDLLEKLKISNIINNFLFKPYLQICNYQMKRLNIIKIYCL